MKRFFFHIRENGVLLRDPEGVVCVDAEQACTGASEAMREFKRDISHVPAPWPVQLEVTDAEGAVIATFSSADLEEASPVVAASKAFAH